jgi:hypothetical protein
LKAVRTRSGRLAGTLTGAMPSGVADMAGEADNECVAGGKSEPKCE